MDVDFLAQACHLNLCSEPDFHVSWQDLAADLFGSLPSCEYLFVVVDYFSCFFETEVMQSTTSRKLINSLERMFSRHGMPLSLETDNGPQFSSDEFSTYV